MTIRESEVKNFNVNDVKSRVRGKSVAELLSWRAIFTKIYNEANAAGDKRVEGDDNPVSIQIGIIEAELKRRGIKNVDQPISQVIGLKSLGLKGKIER